MYEVGDKTNEGKVISLQGTCFTAHFNYNIIQLSLINLSLYNFTYLRNLISFTAFMLCVYTCIHIHYYFNCNYIYLCLIILFVVFQMLENYKTRRLENVGNIDLVKDSEKEIKKCQC